ncbi:MAG: RNA polymerase factor sigma-54 [Desulfobacteraceae bacterium]|nr:RNA polymerase factor sigma-54 [Desulfobacteraceae bacterium]MBC2757076.1 RNA polymerase factor sigma-54 [Desulfobacteraceae bacterium]MBC2763707.1 RNA polymerase factor sigma-54 [ANME-2 cluster archaeon]
MAIELHQTLRLQQQLVMTPQLQMAIKLLQLSKLELVEMIQQEIETNPTLEDSREISTDEDIDRSDSEPLRTKEVSIDEKFDNYLDWHHYIDEFNSTGKIHFESERKEAPDLEAFTTNKTSLADHLRWQLLMTQPSPEDEEIGSQIIGNINKDGYLDISVEDIAEISNYSPEKIRQVLSLIQSFDPPGVCAADLKECLLLQTRHLAIENPLINDIIRFHIKELETKRYKVIAKSLKTDINSVISAVQFIKTLDPKPGDKFNDDHLIYITPDVYVHKEGDDYLILLNDDDMPKLHINSYYKKAIRRGEKIADETKAYLKDRLRSAEWLIKSIHHRRKTIYNVMESIIKFQRDFFDHGIDHLKPMVLRDVADDIEMHESTISRVTNNKYAYTPQGIFELKFFFNSSINCSNGGSIASASVQEKIRKLIESENHKKPYSDKKITEVLEASDIHIARRTVAKYREMMGILPSSKRKQF